jgi:zinc transporter ZupT
MILKLCVLFLTPLLSGLVVYLVRPSRSANFKLVLVFAGAYLFAITVTHILPELYLDNGGLAHVGVFVLAGFFLQQILEYFTAGIEHGHLPAETDQHHGHTHRKVSALVLLTGLCVHNFLEGGVLAQPLTMGPHYDLNAILLGIALHTAPAAFALMTVLASQFHSKRKAIPYLLIFSLASPAGLLLSTYFLKTEVMGTPGLNYLYALVCGNFLHISTTIVFESSPEHHFNARKLIVAISGAIAALAVEWLA